MRTPNRSHLREIPRSFARRTLALLAALLAVIVATPARAGNPRLVNAQTGPVTWAGGQAFFNTDAGPLGILDNATSTQIVRDGFANWLAVPTALIAVEDRGPILLDGAPVDVNIGNFTRVMFQRDGQSPIIYDHDGAISRALGIDSFAGVSFVEYLDGPGEHYVEMAIVLDGTDIDGAGGFSPTGWRGLVAHEEGHHLGLAHSVVNGQAYFFNDPILGYGPPPVTSLETMYPFLGDDGGQAFPARDDATILSTLYPAPSFAPAAAIAGRIYDPRAFGTQYQGANVQIRNVADPYDDAYASISGALEFYNTSFSPISGIYRVEGLNPAASYTVAVSDITAGGFSSPIASPLIGPDEFYNGANESGDPDLDIPSELTLVSASLSPPSTDITLNAPAAIRVLRDPSGLFPPDDASVSGFGVPAAIDIHEVKIEFADFDSDGSQETFVATVKADQPFDSPDTPRAVEVRVQIDFGEPQRIRRYTLALGDQTVEPGTFGVATADITLSMTFDRGGNPVFAGLPSLGVDSGNSGGAAVFIAPVEEIFAAATQAQLDAANNFDGTYSVLVFTSARLHHDLDRVPDTNDNDDPSVARETTRLTFSPFPVVPTHLGSVPDGTLIGVEEGSARALRIGNTGFRSFSDLALSDDGRLFGSLGYGGNGGIIRVNPDTGQAVFLGPSGFAAVPGLDFAPAGTPYAGTLFGTASPASGATDYALVRIDQATGAGTVVGFIGVPFVDCLVFTDDGRLYGVGFVNSAAVLARIDPATGAGTIVGPIGVTAVTGLEVSADGALLGSLGGVDPQSGGLVRIDPNTGASVFIGATGFRPVSGLTKLP